MPAPIIMTSTLVVGGLAIEPIATEMARKTIELMDVSANVLWWVLLTVRLRVRVRVRIRFDKQGLQTGQVFMASRYRRSLTISPRHQRSASIARTQPTDRY